MVDWLQKGVFPSPTVVSSVSFGSALVRAPFGGQLVVLQQTGQALLFDPSTNTTSVFLSVSVDSRSERGLLGLAFSPTFDLDRHVYVYYTSFFDNRNRISRFRQDGPGGPLVEETLVFRLPVR